MVRDFRPMSRIRAVGRAAPAPRATDVSSPTAPFLASITPTTLASQVSRRTVSAETRVPSVIIPEEDNLIINPTHPRAAELRIVSERRFSYDPRLLGR